MIYNIYDLLNFLLCLSILVLVGIKYELSSKVMLILLLHLLFTATFDLFIPINYMPDQLRYYAVSRALRGSLPPTTEHGNVYYAGAYFAFFPLFIISVKSIAFINFLIYLFLFIFLNSKFRTPETQYYFKVFYLLYPSLFMYSSLGLRDMLIVLLMIMSMFFLFFYEGKFKWVLISSFIIGLFFIKFQNSLILAILIIAKRIRGIQSKRLKIILIGLLMALTIFCLIAFGDVLAFYRRAMYLEDTGLLPYDIPSWTPIELYRFFLAPFFIDAKNGMQLVQSCENFILMYFALKLLAYKSKLQLILKDELFLINFFILLSGVIYSYVVFNYGTISRYKFPFVTCWFIITLLIYDKSKSSVAKSFSA